MTEQPPLRADARENRLRILDAAEEVFGRGGEHASTEDVARLAGVGIATVFRHFPTKAALLEEVLVRRFVRLRDFASALADAEDAGAAFAALFRHVVADAPGKIAIGEAIVAAGGAHERTNEVAEQYRERVAVLVRLAQDAGAVRTDVSADDVHALLVAASRAGALLPLDEDARERIVSVVLDGLSARGAPAR
jgi:AcrR family transcriptional regulator